MRRRRRVAIACLAALVGAGAAAIASSGSSDDGAGRSGASGQTATGRPAVRTKLVASTTAKLPAAISGEAVAAGGGRVLIVGGLDASNQSVDGVFSLDPASGHVRLVGQLGQPLHDAAAASLRGSTLVMGGGDAASTDAVERLDSGGAAVVSHLPTARSDLVAARAGGRVWAIGGYDGQTLAPDALATSDGRRFTAAARLPVPVRYPAVATAAGTIYLFGGETASGRPTGAIQSIDASTGRARVIGHLDRPLAHASAIALHGRIYVLGGTAGGRATDAIVAFDPGRRRISAAGRLPTPVTNAAAVALGGRGYLVGGLGQAGAPLSSVIGLRLRNVRVPAPRRPPPASSSAGSSGGGPFRGHLLIADRGNNRLLVVNPAKRVLWRYPGSRPQPKGGFYFPDDAFFIHGGRGIISNEEENEAIVEIAYPSGKVLRSFGHPGMIGSSPGYFHEPDDAYLLRDGTVTVADAQNCRIVFLGPGAGTSQIGTTGDCAHDPPHSLAAPNGDTPLANGDVLVSEVQGSYVDEFTRGGHLVWSTHAPDRVPVGPSEARARSLPGRRLQPARRRLRVQSRRAHPLVLPPAERRRNARPPEPRRTVPGRPRRRDRRLPRPRRPHRSADQADRVAVRAH